MASEGLHEPLQLLDEAIIDQHRAKASLCEELEAIGWYDQRVKATSDASLAAVLAHNRDEEKEHAAMILEWLRRHDAVLDGHLRTFLFTAEPITQVEAESAGTAPGPAGAPGTNRSGSLGIGSLNGAEGLTTCTGTWRPSPTRDGRRSIRTPRHGSPPTWRPESWWTLLDHTVGRTPPLPWVGSSRSPHRRRALRQRNGASCLWWSCGPNSRSRAPKWTTRSAEPPTSISPNWTRRRGRSHSRRT